MTITSKFKGKIKKTWSDIQAERQFKKEVARERKKAYQKEKLRLAPKLAEHRAKIEYERKLARMRTEPTSKLGGFVSGMKGVGEYLSTPGLKHSAPKLKKHKVFKKKKKKARSYSDIPDILKVDGL